MDKKEYSAALRIFTAEAHTDFISEALHVRPSAVYLKGTSLGGRSSKGPNRNESLWIYDSPLACSESLEKHILAVIKPLTEASGMDQIRNRIAALEIFCMFTSENGQGTVSLAPTLVSQLGALGIGFVLDTYLSERPD